MINNELADLQNKRIRGLTHCVDPQGFLDQHNKVNISMFIESRKRLYERMKSLETNSEQLNKSMIVLQGGSNSHRYDTDVEYIFRQESTFYYLFGINEPNMYGGISMETGKSYLFIPRYDEKYDVWSGDRKSTSFYKEKYGIDHVDYVDTMSKLLCDEGIQNIHVMEGTNMYSGRNVEKTNFPGINDFVINGSILYSELCELRVIKSPKELELLRFVNQISCEAHINIMKNIKSMESEHEIEAMFLHYIAKYYGCRHVSYGCICCSGHNGAILHYGHASQPNDRPMDDDQNQMMLLDMGAEYYCYGSDITCSFPRTGKFTEDQKLIYNAVLEAQVSTIEIVRPGRSWQDLKYNAQCVIVKHLINIGIINPQGKEIHELVAVHKIGDVFMPHGLGHLMGMDVHDVDGYGSNYNVIGSDGKINTVRVLRSGMVITVEPGIYFIETLYGPFLEDPMKGQFLNWDILKRFVNFGGCRLEDDIIVLDNGCENMTKIPKTIEEIEEIMK